MTWSEMPDRSGSGLGLSLILALVFANLLGGDLRGVRPQMDSPGSAPAIGDETVPARLWRDPLQAGYAYAASLKQAREDLPEELRPAALRTGSDLECEVRRRAREPLAISGEGEGEEGERTSRSILVMPVLVPGGDGAERHELRLRRRYAVLSALTGDGARAERDKPEDGAQKGPDWGYAALHPEDPNHIGLARIEFSDPVPEGSKRAVEANDSPRSSEGGASGGGFRLGTPKRGVEANREPELSGGATHSDPEASGRCGGANGDSGGLGRDADGGRACSSLLVPFEWFSCTEPEENGYSDCLVLWIDEFAIQDRPLDSLARIVGPLKEQARDRVDVKIQGPTESGLLLAMREEASSWDSSAVGGHRDALRGSVLLSPRSTLAVDPRDGFELGGEDLTGAFGSMEMRLERTIGTDDELAHLLIRELVLRRPDLFPSSDCALESPFAEMRWVLRRPLLGILREPKPDEALRVALVSELDTDYGRAWANMLTKAADEICPQRIQVESKVRYMRGLDGVIPGQGTPAVEEQEPAAGGKQADYVRRLERLLHDEPYDAIGILGNDVYDKAALLQVLRPHFPDALFFTTDVDARLLPDLSSPHTLNLLVGSHYGLLLDENLQYGLPPLRSNYQAASYLATMRALDSRAPMWRPTARVFEVGRSWIHQLTTPGGGARSGDESTDPTPPESQLPGPWLFVQDHQHALWVLLALALLVFGLARAPTIESVGRRLSAARESLRSAWAAKGVYGVLKAHPRQSLALLFAVVALPVLGGLVALFRYMESVSDSRVGEPFFVVEGISSWPTVWIRILAIVAAVVGYFRVWHSVQTIREDVNREHVGALAPFADAWKDFERETGWWRVTVWSFGFGILYRLLTGLLFRFLPGGSVPMRGEEAYLIERFVLWLSILLFVLLVFVVLRITVLASHFLRALGTDETPENEAKNALPRLRLAQSVGGRVGTFVWWPATVLFLMMLSRANLFDRWTWPIALILTLALSFLLLLLVGHRVRGAAQRLRSLSVARLEALRLKLAGSEVDRCKALLEQVRGLRGGVFAPIWEHPLLRAWLLPLAALGANTSLELWLPTLLAT